MRAHKKSGHRRNVDFHTSYCNAWFTILHMYVHRETISSRLLVVSCKFLFPNFIRLNCVTPGSVIVVITCTGYRARIRIDLPTINSEDQQKPAISAYYGIPSRTRCDYNSKIRKFVANELLQSFSRWKCQAIPLKVMFTVWISCRMQSFHQNFLDVID